MHNFEDNTRADTFMGAVTKGLVGGLLVLPGGMLRSVIRVLVGELLLR